MAPGANIVLVIATDHASQDEAINFAVVHHLGNTISNSWCSIEVSGIRLAMTESIASSKWRQRKGST